MLDVPPDAPNFEVYYSSACAPCRLEMPVVLRLAEDDTARVVIVLLGDAQRALAELAAISETLPGLTRSAGEHDVRTALKAAGNDRGILPYSRAITRTGRTCAAWSGVLSLDRARRMLAACMGAS